MSTHHEGQPLASGEGIDDAGVKRKRGTAIKLLLIFCAMYFTAAVIATREFAHIAGIEIFGIPLAIYTGLLVFVVGIVVTRMCLTQDKGA
ncbi:hypothetical protein [Silanimonas sp.]|uniref:hypothetical protein n=1 Tax=Silanimonas sp. TaxID=1929290 RepID=UPI001BC0D67A|nr:hypothetical protein [Silanimonas sp.]MBS3896804.1 hypothetical protein [Silanimonas sp.]MBS3924166.1 hypothetical protein [Xanthomonadaceae bacterium]